jgi:hypothetical protein
MTTLNPVDQLWVQPGRQLAIGVLRGYWTLEQLDEPSAHWVLNERDRAVSNARRTSTKRFSAWTVGHPYRNLARDWIETHPDQFNALLQQELERENDTAMEQNHV